MRHYGIATAVALLGWSGLSSAANPQPVQVPVSTEWFGYDGTWSPVNIRVGSPQQWVSSFPSTLSHDIWVIGASGCDETTACVSKRGGIFKANESSTWTSIGPYALNFQPALGVTGSADYGLDTIAIGDAISVPDQIVGVMNSTEFLLGSLGLGIIPSNFSSNKNQATFLTSMVENQSAIPSYSYGYTAGAYYRLKGVPASLTLGGVDLNRFVPNDVSFNMTSDFEPVVSINAISVSSNPLSTSATTPNWTQETFSLLQSSQAELFTIDSSTPFLWLPGKVCDAFAMAFNLTYNETLQLYLYGNGTDPSVLSDWNMTFTFTLADLPESPNTVDITLPYNAFNQQLSFPFPALNTTFSSPAVNYFPLRRASNNTQFTIGRVFLQESYLAVDYERNNFSISQAKFANDAVTRVNLASITRPQDSIFAGPPRDAAGGLSTGAKAGIGIGIGLSVVAAIGLLLLLYFRRKRSNASESPPEKKGLFKRKRKDGSKGPAATASELLADKRHPLEVPADKSACRFELQGNTPVEMPAEVPSSYFAADKARNATALAELGNRDSISRNSIPRHLNRSSQSPSLPPYCPAQVGGRSGSNVSPSSTLFNPTGLGSGTQSSGISGISPHEPSPTNHSRKNSCALETGASRSQPLSPHEPSPLIQPTQLNNSASQSHLALPQPRGGEPAVPRRSVSRGSRFREEGISAEPQPPQQAAQRFSWQDDR
ncbi:hypothetical protein EPUS_02780 [Endocarpon pusillum Z07020]|uniref:Peptidase A1 domain-containing protein n=1 Tax=Endocarpon pusillum (strain Z07020 / HMAS-L-300199) TaxID=1263415 RepID=U1HHJ2_ENDPU|nr:uncharacterized protein EPUS_02780 [Endocarpon pusillum Z07020]ERF68324.1 hypothetical protein EPUS_02780 [Endocarpon pusillum Z07020]